MKRIAIDMDEVIADFNSKMVPRFNQRFAKSITHDDLDGHTIEQLFPELKSDITIMIGESGFFADLSVIVDSQSVIKQLSERYDIFITTAAMEFPGSFTAKFLWLEKHFPFIDPMNIVFCGNKSILHADYLIDDNARHFKGFCGEGLLFSAPHNAQVEGFRRVNNWQEIAALFLR